MIAGCRIDDLQSDWQRGARSLDANLGGLSSESCPQDELEDRLNQDSELGEPTEMTMSV